MPVSEAKSTSWWQLQCWDQPQLERQAACIVQRPSHKSLWCETQSFLQGMLVLMD